MTEREWDKRLHIRTIGREDEDNPHYSPYEPTPYSVLQRLADSGYIGRKDRLLDYGCGKGRVAFFMASVIGCRVTGIDHSRKLILYYPSEEYMTWLNLMPEVEHLDTIDCGDLFNGKNDRERIEVFRLRNTALI